MVVLYIKPMVKGCWYFCLLNFILVFLFIAESDQLQSSEGEALLRIQRLLNYPRALSGWNSSTDFCSTEPSSSVTVVCYEDRITQLHIIGANGAPSLPRNFSIGSFMMALVGLPNLKVLTLASLGLWGTLPGKIARLSSLEIFNVSSNFLYDAIPEEISSLTGLQTLILDDNMFSGEIPDWIGSLPVLSVLSLRKNMFNGTLPKSLCLSENLRVLAVSENYLYGEVCDLSSLTNLQLLDLEDNTFGPKFPKLSNKLVTLVLSKNKFRDGVPSDVTSYYQLQQLDLANNNFVGPFPQAILSLPSLRYLNIKDNKFTGMLFENQSCSAELEFVDISSNFLTGHLPECLASHSERKVVYSANCLDTEDADQHPLSFCRNEALAVGIVPQRSRSKGISKLALVLTIVAGAIGGIVLVAFIVLYLRRTSCTKASKKTPTRLISENALTGYPSKLLSDARYISQTMKLGALGLPAYHSFSLEELKEATNNFDTSAFTEGTSQGQVYITRLKDGLCVTIKCLDLKRSQSTQNLTHYIELISKVRHRHLVSALGHCFEYCSDESKVCRIYLVFECIQNGTLRSWTSEEHRPRLNWAQRIAAAIGVAKGIQFLHTGIVPGVYPNDLKITDILLDQNLVVKVCSYNLPLLLEITGKINQVTSSMGSKDRSAKASKTYQEKNDIYDFGVILLEIIFGRPAKSRNEVNSLKDQLHTGILSDNAARRSIIDPTINQTCSDQSLMTMMEVCFKCLHKNPADRPSVEDVLWNLQFAAQVQDAWGRDSLSGEGSPVSPSHPARLHLTMR